MAGDTLPAEKTILHHAEEGHLEKREASTDVPQQMILTAEHKASNRRLNRRLDIFLLPLLSLLYLFNGLDRSNIGNAETQGMIHLEEDMDRHKSRY